MFKKASLNKKYIITGGDCAVTTPDGYSGNISDITDETVIDGMISRGSNLVALKEATPPPLPGKEADKDNTGKTNK